MWNYSEERLRTVFVILLVLSILGELALIGLVFDGVDWNSDGNNVLAILCFGVIALTSIEAWNVGTRVYKRAFVDWPKLQQGGDATPPTPTAL